MDPQVLINASWYYIFGAICPKDGKGAALIMPRCDTEAMNLHLAEIADPDRAGSALCPKDGKGAALIMPRCDTEAMNLHLAEIATQIAPGAHAVLLVDQAGWHLSGRLIVRPTSL